MNKLLLFIDMDSDKWIFPSNGNLPPYTFKFQFLPNEWFKKTVKRVTKECIIIGKLKISTLQRYNQTLEHFFKYLNKSEITLATFRDISFDIVEGFIHYLLTNLKKPQTRSVAISALKHHIRHGQLFEWDGFPINDIFDGTERRTLQTEDSLKSIMIDDSTLKNIDNALSELKSILEPKIEYLNDIVLWTLITIIRHTGIRLSEALNLNIDCIKKDLMNKYLLEVVSEKNNTERFIPINQEVVEAIEVLIKTSEDFRGRLNITKIFYFHGTSEKVYEPFEQNLARKWLKTRFIEKFNICDNNGNLIKLTYHQFRHHIGTELLNNGMDIFEVQQYLGHKSQHSTRLYAKVQRSQLSKEYKKLGFIGYIEESTTNILDSNGERIDSERLLMAQLPDGVCAKPLHKEVLNCKLPNACLFCPKFITTPEYLYIHKDHLKRIRADKDRYVKENLIGTDYLLLETEKVLENIVSRLENLQMEKVK